MSHAGKRLLVSLVGAALAWQVETGSAGGAEGPEAAVRWSRPKQARHEEPVSGPALSGPSPRDTAADDGGLKATEAPRLRPSPGSAAESGSWQRAGTTRPRPGFRAAETAPPAEEGAVAADAAPDADPDGDDGAALLQRAAAESKQASDEAAYRRIIEACGRGRAAGLERADEKFAHRLEAWARNRLGETLAEEGQEQAALEEFERAIELDPQRWRAIHNRGVSLAALGRRSEALREFDRTIRLNPRYATAHFNRGELRYEAGDLEGAIDDYTQALQLNPRDAVALNSRGHAYYLREQFRQAVADYTAAIAIDPQNAAAHTNRGDVYADLGRYEPALREYRTALRLSPGLGRAHQSLAWLMATCPDARFRDERRALESALKAIELDGDSDPLYVETLAAAQANAGRFAAAQQTLQKAQAAATKAQQPRYQQLLSLYKRNEAYREQPRQLAQAPSRGPAPRGGVRSPDGGARPARYGTAPRPTR
jgi:tetratricopeptide (TPR) repeat protein